VNVRLYVWCSRDDGEKEEEDLEGILKLVKDRKIVVERVSRKRLSFLSHDRPHQVASLCFPLLPFASPWHPSK